MSDPRIITCDVCDGEGRDLRSNGGPDDIDCGECPQCKGDRVIEIETQPVEMEDLR